MPKIVNRKVQGVDNVDYDDLDYKFQNIVAPSGINESQNFVAVDQNSLADADNVYIDEDGVLSSRPAIKSITVPYISNDTSIVDLINVNGVVFYHLFKDNEYSVAFEYNDSWYEHSCGQKLTVTFMSDMFIFFTTNDIFAYKITGEWKTYSDIMYIPKVIQAGQSSTAEAANIFADGTAVEYILKSDVETNFSELNGKDITVNIDEDSYSMKFATGMQSTFTRKINVLTLSNVSVSLNGSMISYSMSRVNGSLIITIYYSADGKLFHELPPLPLGTMIGDVLSYNVVLSNSGNVIYCLVKGSNKTSIYYIMTASLSTWLYSDCEYIIYNYAEAQLSSIFASSTYDNVAKLDTDGSTKGYALDDDCIVFYTRKFDRTVTCSSRKRDTSTGGAFENNFHDCQQSFLHVGKIISGTLIIKSYSILDNFDNANYDGLSIRDPLNYVLQLKLAVDSVSNTSCLCIVLSKNLGALTGQQVYLAKILFNSSMEPFFYTDFLIKDTTDLTNVNVIDYAVVVNYVFEYKRLGGDIYYYRPTTIDVCYTHYNSSVLQYRYCIYKGNNTLECRYDTVTFTQNNDRGVTQVIKNGTNVIYQQDNVNLLGQQKFIATSDFATDYDTITLQYAQGSYTQRPAVIKSTSNFSKILTDDEVYISAYATSFKLLHENSTPIAADWNDSILYSNGAKLYATDWTTPIYINVLSSAVKYNFIAVSKFLSFTNDFIAYDNKICHRTNLDNNQIYFSVLNEVKFSSNVTNLIQLSQTSLAVFLKDGVFIVKYEGIDSSSGKSAYTCTRSKLQLGCRDGDDVLLTYDGSTILLPTLKGLTSLSYEQLMINNEQVYSYLSDQLSDLYKDFVDGQIKLYQYKSYIIVYSSVKKYCYIYDLQNQSWWKWSCSKILSRIVYDGEFILLLIEGHIFTLTDSGQYLDFGHEVINWHFMSQKLHFGAPNNYKHIYAISLESSVEVPEDVRYAFKCINYRKSKDVNDAEIFEYNINGIRLYVKRCNYYKSNAFQFELSNIYNEQPKQMKLANIAIKYRITESIR